MAGRFALLVCFLAPYCHGGPIVRTDSGIVEGIIKMSAFKNKTFYSFRGIPYAQPPVGDLRFEEPQPPLPWVGTRDATKDTSICIQKNVVIPDAKVEGSEDCLYINVYTPKIPNSKPTADSPKKLLPVLAYIHGGGFFAFSSKSTEVGPEFFMDRGDVVLVTFNYRLGVMGFLSTNSDDLPGNMAFKDQTAALQWVQRNIKNFGGNSSEVTIFGQSAGGASVHFHVLSPLSDGLFHKAISQSGSALTLWTSPAYDPKWVFDKQCAILGCPTGNISIALQCLKSVKAEDVVAAVDNFRFWSVDPMNVFGYSLEKPSARNPRPFLTEKPLKLIEKGLFKKIPFIMGTIKNEGLLRAGPILAEETLRSNLSQSFDTLMPIFMGLQSTSKPEDVPQLWQSTKDLYFKGKNYLDITDRENVAGFVDLYGDRAFTYYVYFAALMHARAGHETVYFYNFNYKGSTTYIDYFTGRSNLSDINYEFDKCHCDELLYLFNYPDFFNQNWPPNHPDRQMVQFLTKMWTDFASSRNFDVPWEPLPSKGDNLLQNGEFRFLNITSPSDARMDSDYFTERMSFWDKREPYIPSSRK